MENADRAMDFSLYDYDKDGVVDLVVVVHQGEGYETSGDGADIMSHQWSLAEAGQYDAAYGYSLQINPVMVDGVMIDKYLILPETQYGNLLSSAEISRELEQPIKKTDGEGNGAGAGAGVIGALVKKNVNAATYVTISGTVGPVARQGIQNVTLTFSGGQGTAITDIYGNYSKQVPYGWTGTVTPYRSDKIFDPSSRSYVNVTINQTSQNYTALDIPVPNPPPTTSVIMGYIKTASGVPMADVTVVCNPAAGQSSCVTDANGQYGINIRTNRWSGTLTPSKTGCTFSPSSRSYNLTNGVVLQDQNFTATCPPITISGWVIGSGFMQKNIKVVFLTAGNGAGTAVYTDSSGYYSAQVQYGWSGTITPSQTGYAFSPASKSVSNVTTNLSQVNFMASLVSPVTISGRVTTSSGSGVCAVLNWSNGDQFCTDSSGNYSRQVPKGWSGTVTPSSSSYTFSPASRSYSNLTVNQANQNYVAIYQVTFSGYVMTSTGAGISGVTLSFSNGGGSGTTDASGYYSTKVGSGWTGTVTPIKSGYTFSPSSKSYTKVSANVWQCYTGTKK